MPAVQPAAQSLRQIYLESIGLVRFDPFATPVAEQELALSTYWLPGSALVDAQDKDHQSSLVGSDKEVSTSESGGTPPPQEIRRPYFFDYFSTPPLSDLPAGQNARQVLRQSGVAVVYGRHGDGKTMLRLALEADCRGDTDRTLVISYPLTDDVRQPLRADEHWTQLAKALATDLFIQVIEQFNPLDPAPTDDQIEALRSQIVMGGGRLKRLTERILHEPEPPTVFGLSEFWSLVNRPIVRRVVRSPALTQLLERSLPMEPPVESATGEEALTAGLHAARRWGFERCFALVDGVDTRQRSADAMSALIQPLLDALPIWAQRQLLFKFFLPVTLRDRVSTVLRHVGQNLTSQPIESIIGPWNEPSLRALLIERFRAAGSRRVGFDDLAGPDIPGSFDQILFRTALGSPRRLLQIISSLIDAHVARAPRDWLIRLADWDRMRALWSCDPPTPPSLVDS